MMGQRTGGSACFVSSGVPCRPDVGIGGDPGKVPVQENASLIHREDMLVERPCQ
jgi:hypothetical protein